MISTPHIVTPRRFQSLDPAMGTLLECAILIIFLEALADETDKHVVIQDNLLPFAVRALFLDPTHPQVPEFCILQSILPDTRRTPSAGTVIHLTFKESSVIAHIDLSIRELDLREHAFQLLPQVPRVSRHPIFVNVGPVLIRLSPWLTEGHAPLIVIL